MIERYDPISPKIPYMLHGGDYNPDQWPEEVWAEDMRLMKLAHCNVMSVGIFSWTRLEPAEGVYDFDWLDRIMDMLAENDVSAILATPSGARPAWLSAQYPEVLRVRPDRGRNLQGRRHNHCFTSPIYREKTRALNTLLAERYKDHPALILWHMSNEYSGECHCELCRSAFRGLAKGTIRFAGQTQPRLVDRRSGATRTRPGNRSNHPAPLARRLSMARIWTGNASSPTRQLTSCLTRWRHCARFTPDVPITTNLMGTYPGLNYWRMAPHLDVISWDSYPQWHSNQSDADLGSHIAFLHDINRSLKGGRPFMLMESTPSMTNWMPVAKLKRPGMHLLSSLQAIAHGSDTVQYFQWRKSRGASEKFHGAVVDHHGTEESRVFKDVAEVGKALEKLEAVVGTTTRPDVALIYDWENAWVINDAQGPRIEGKDYLPTCLRHYNQFWRRGIPVDVIDMEQDLSSYKLVIAPMLHMVRPGVAERIDAFVRAGGVFVATYWSGIVDENDLCFLGGFPGPLRSILGIWDEEIDALYDGQTNRVLPLETNALGLSGEYTASTFCALIHAESAEVLAAYGDDFYAGRPALTVNQHGNGQAYYIASRNDDDFLSDFYGRLADVLALQHSLDVPLPVGVSAQVRCDGDKRYVFVMNFTPKMCTFDLGNITKIDLLSGEPLSGIVPLDAYAVKVLV